VQVGLFPRCSTSGADYQAFWGIPGYTFKGIYKELQKHLGSSVQNYIIAARTAQGYDEWMSSNREERLDVVSRWHTTQLELNKGMHQVRQVSFRTPQEMLRSRQTSYERKKAAEGKIKQKEVPSEHWTKGNRSRNSAPSAASIQAQPGGKKDMNPNSIAFEEAIQDSVLATSKGNPEEDKMIERAIRASVAELQSASEGDGDDAVRRAIQASIAEATRGRAEDGTTPPSQVDGLSDHDEQLKAALRRSLLEYHQSNESGIRDPRHDSDDSGIATDDDENVQSALEMSRASSAGKHRTESDKNLQKAIEESKRAHEVHEGLAKTKTEEEIIREFIKKQSEAEEQSRTFKASGAVFSSDLEEAELRQAVNESLKTHKSES